MEPQAPSPRAATAALFSLSLAVLLAALGTSIANVALPTLVTAFHASFQAVQWVVLAYLLAVTTLIVSVGRLGDLFGRRRCLVVGILLFGLASALCGLAPTLPLLIAARALQGLGAAAMMALTLAFVGEAVAREKTGSAMGLLGTMSAVGTALGPSLGGLLVSSVGWRAIFLVNVPLALVAAWLVVRHLPAAPRRADATPGFDWPGTAFLGVALGAFSMAMTAGTHQQRALLAGLAVAGLGAFLATQKHARSPLVRWQLFARPALGSGFAASALVTAVVMATLVVGPFYLSAGLDLTPAKVGLVMSAGPVVAALTGAPAGRLVDRLGTPAVAACGLGIMLAGACLLAVLPAAAGIPGYIGSLILVTSGYAGFQAANNTSVMQASDAQSRGVVGGLLNLARNLGLITGASLMGAVFASRAGKVPAQATQAAVESGLHHTFALASALVLVALAVALANRAASRRA